MEVMPNRWRGFVLGALGGVVGLFAMSAYWQTVAALTGQDPRENKENPPPDTLDSISLVGTHHEPGESSTAALGRILYEQITGRTPAKQTRTLLSDLVHWGFSLGASGAYGAARSQTLPPDIGGGLVLAIALWLVGDEVVMPLAGLTDGPTAYPLALHGHSLGAHVAYGVASAAATRLLEWLVEG